MKKQLFISTILTLFFIFSFQSCMDEKDPLTTNDYHALKTDMRSLWSDHVVWTRVVIIGMVDNTPGTNEAVARLLQNQEDIGNAVKPYYGDANGNTLTDLLTEHITTAADLITAAVNNDTPGFNTAHAAWYANADEIATTLHTLNPDHWPLQMMKDMMKEHLDLTLVEVQARIDQNYTTDVATFDQIYDQAMHMADMLSEGIAKQHPGQFN
jgi:hypothetical protein